MAHARLNRHQNAPIRIATPTAMSARPTTVFVWTAGEASGLAAGLGDAAGVTEGVGDGGVVAVGVGLGVGLSVGVAVGDGVGDGVAVGEGGGAVVRGGGVVGVGVATAWSTVTEPCICGWIPQMYA